MKVVVTYEKADMLRLVQEDLKRQGIRLKPGTAVEYKGAMQSRFEIETDEEKNASPPTASVSPASPKIETVPTQATAEDPSMGSLFAESEKLVRTREGKFAVTKGPPRPLGANESLEFPRSNKE